MELNTRFIIQIPFLIEEKKTHRIPLIKEVKIKCGETNRSIL